MGGVFNSVNASVYEQRENPVAVKSTYYQKDLADWAEHQGIVIGTPAVFPVNSVKAMRGCFVAQENELLSDYVGHVFYSYWTELNDISQDEVLAVILDKTGLDRDEFFQKITDQAYKDKLRANTDELIRRGGFGSPTMFVDESDMYFGNDRLVLLEAALARGVD